MGGKGKNSKGGSAGKGKKGKDGGDTKASEGKAGGKANKGKGSMKAGKNSSDRSFEKPSVAYHQQPKSSQEVEADLVTKSPSDDHGHGPKTNLEAKGAHCTVRKHSDMGCAVITFESEAMRDRVLELAASKTPPGQRNNTDRPEVRVNDFTIQMRPHVDKRTEVEIKTNIFAAWGRQNEKRSPLPVPTIAETFDALFREANPSMAQAQLQPQALVQTQPAQTAAVPAGMQAPYMHPMMGAGQAASLMSSLTAMPMHPQHYGMPAMAQWHQQMAHMASMAAAHQAQAHQAHQVANQVRQAQQEAQPPATPDRGSSYNGCDGSREAGYPMAQERKALSIVDPKSGEPIKLEADFMSGRKAMSIVDPRSGEALKFNLPQPEAARPLSIIDPNSGNPVDTTGVKSEVPKVSDPSPAGPDDSTNQ
mmetsp:Transcript_65946/g.127205  ORF Transcript_65946/g.127205 Transcript_65946/m.127205 type:complete len:420 (-) Transcript_65946:55-1314(-)